MDKQQFIDRIMFQQLELSMFKLRAEISDAIVSTQEEIHSELVAIVTRLLVGVDEQWMTFPENKELMIKVHEYIDGEEKS